jgi:hypothetical protein
METVKRHFFLFRENAFLLSGCRESIDGHSFFAVAHHEGNINNLTPEVASLLAVL